jgi:hypothetical protein
MAGNAVFHPIDAAGSLGEGALGIAEHVPIVPGLNTAVKGTHGLVDLAEGKQDGKYGGSLTDLGENLLLDTQQDPNNPSKRTNTDVEFLAGLGGGTKVWSEKPMEAATRTLTNLAPMLLGDEAAGANTVPEEPPVPSEVDPLGKTQVDPLGKTQVDPFGKTQDLGNTQVDPANPEPEPDGPKVDPAATPEQIRQNLIDANAAQKATQEASIKATQEYVRYRAKMPEPARGFAGDPNWDPRVDEALYNETLRAEQANIRAIKNLQAWQRAAKAAQGL